MKCLTAHDLPADVRRLILLHAQIDRMVVWLQSQGRSKVLFDPTTWAHFSKGEATFIRDYFWLHHIVVQRPDITDSQET